MKTEKLVFPSWRYHKQLGSKIVHHESEDESLGEGWVKSPAHFEPDPEVTQAAVEPEKAQSKKKGK